MAGIFSLPTSIGNLFKVRIDPGERGTGEVVRDLKDADGVHGVVVVPSKNIAFFTKGGDNTVGVLGTATLQQIGSIPVADDPDAILYAERANLISVANGDAGIRDAHRSR